MYKNVEISSLIVALGLGTDRAPVHATRGSAESAGDGGIQVLEGLRCGLRRGASLHRL